MSEPAFIPLDSPREAELLAALRRVPGVSAVNTKPQKPANKPNHFGVTYELRLAGESRSTTKRKACTKADSAQPRLSVADCAAAVLHDLRSQVGEREVDAALLLRADEAPLPAPATAEELEWLASWIESHDAPESVTVQIAEAALAERRAARGATSSRSATDVLQQTQLLQAQLRAAERSALRAQQSVERWRSEIAAHQAPKRPRLEVAGAADHPRVAQGGTNPTGWEFFGSYSRSKYQEEEVKEQDRRAVGVDRERRETRPPDDDRWGHHWRRGVFGAMRGWAAGSLGAIIFMIIACARHFEVVDEVGEALGFLPRAQKIAGTEFDRNDWVLAVKWWVKTADDPEERTYEEWEPTRADIAAHGIETADGVYFLLNSTELRHTGFPMDAVDPLPAAPVPISARTRRSSAEAERPSTDGRRFRLPADVENQILALNW